jgi:2-polyprenyl-6-methoxyphenol hydroxylase-like FAD-dependent oxidoreductase
MTRARTAVIVGAGIAGPVVALALRQAGIDSTIYEAYATDAEGIGGLLMVAPNGLQALRISGADVSAIGQPIQRMIMGDAAASGLASSPVCAVCRPAR